MIKKLSIYLLTILMLVTNVPANIHAEDGIDTTTSDENYVEVQENTETEQGTDGGEAVSYENEEQLPPEENIEENNEDNNISVEPVYYCQKEEHLHTDECYDFYNVLICNEDHEHNENCYQEFKFLHCTQEEHLHDENCEDENYVAPVVELTDEEKRINEAIDKAVNNVDNYYLTCNLEEHEHTPECFEKHTDLICEEDHEHNEDCYFEYYTIACEKNEHNHTIDCVDVHVEGEEENNNEENIDEEEIFLSEDEVTVIEEAPQEPLLQDKELLTETVMLTQNGLKAAPIYQDPVEADGITLRNITIKWLSSSSGEEQQARFNDLVLVPENDIIPNQQFQIDFSLSGKGSIPAGNIEIVIPAYIFKTKEGTEPGILTLAIPEEPSTKQEFAWKRVGDTIVITNTRSLSAGAAFMIQGTFRNTSPDLNSIPTIFNSTYAHEMYDIDTTEDVPYKGVSDDLFAVINVETPRLHEILTMTSNPIRATINTHVEVANVTKKAVDNKVYIDSIPSLIPEELLPENPNDYIYVQWYVSATVNGNQNYDMWLTDTVSDIVYNVTEDEETTVNGIMLGGTSSVAGTVKSEDGKTITMDLFSGYNLDTSLYSDISSKTGYVFTAYPRTDFPKEGVTYRLNNDVEVFVKGYDDKIVTSDTASSQAAFKTQVIWKIDKIWKDDDNAAGHRPERLYTFIYDINKPQGYWYKKVKEFWLSEENNWHAEWKDDGTITEYKAREYSWYTNSNTSVIAEGWSDWEIQEDGSRCRTHWWYTFNPSESTYNDDTHTWTFVNDYHEVRACEGLIPWVPDIAVLTTYKRASNHLNRELKATTDRDLSLLSNGQETSEVIYNITSTSVVSPYTLRDGGTLTNLDDYGFKDVEMKIEDQRVSFASLEAYPNGALTVDDYEIRYVYLRHPVLYKRIQYDPWSSWTYTSIEDTVPVELYGKIGEEWIKYADYSTEGELTVYNGAIAVSDYKVELPANVTHVYTTQKTKADRISAGYQLGIIFKPSKKLKDFADSLFESSDYTITNVYNTERTYIYDDEGNELMSLESGDRTYLHGRNLKLAVDLDKSFAHSKTDYPYYMEFTSTIKLNQQTNVTTDFEYNSALRNGELPFSESGTFYDLLPPGMTAVLDSVEIDDGQIISAEAIENYQGSGRMLLIVKANLTNNYSYVVYPYGSDKRNDDTYPDEGYYRGHTITFKSQITFEEARNRGLTDLRNTAAYEADESEFGNMDYWKGEKDAPSGANHKESETAVRTDLVDLMSNLDPGRDDPNFVYAQGTSSMTEVDDYAVADIKKYVQVTGADSWTNGHDNDVNVPEAGKYSYSIVLTAGSEETKTKDIIILDSIELPTLMEITDLGDNESYQVGELINKSELNSINDELIAEGKRPIQAKEVWHWKGYFRSIDVSEIEALGVEPVVYYSTKPSLDISNEAYYPGLPSPKRQEGVIRSILQDPNGDWSTELPDDPSKVTAIAIDCAKDINGEDFILTNYASLIAYVHMQAPTYDQQPKAFAEEDYYNHLNNAHAYNNVYMDVNQIDDRGNSTRKYEFFKYTKVGIYSSNLEVEKLWEDDNNRDGIRPDEVDITLIQNGTPLENRTITLKKDDNYVGTFEYVPMYDPDGRLYNYSISESAVDGYVSFATLSGNKFTVKNTHSPERVNIPFEKHWTSNEPEGWQVNIPESIEVRLYADGIFTGQRKVVYPAEDGTWSGVFFNMLKYRDEGTEIQYTVQEIVPDDYIVTYSDDTLSITNEYYPYGDIELTKIVKNATEVALDNEFTFTITLHDEFDEEVTGKYAYKIINTETGEIITEKTKIEGIGNGDRINLRDKEKLIIKDVPNKTKYFISEAAKPGFTLTEKVNEEGAVKSLTTEVATFTNTYTSRGMVSLEGTKTLTGRQIKRYAFRFELLDENRNVLYTTANQTSNSSDEQEVWKLNSAPISFPSLSFTEADDGKERIFYIREVNRGIGGYTYDSKEIKVHIFPHDNGNGTMSFDVKYYQYDPETDTESELLNDIVFDNVYGATGEVELKAWKTLSARKLEDDEFTFKLYDNAGNLLQTAKNKADGSIIFEPIEYTQQDAGKTYYYYIKEFIPAIVDDGHDETVIYDTTVYGYSVLVEDNGDGSLKTTSTPVTPIFEGDEEVPSGFTKDGAKLPIFNNELRDGALAITKEVIDSPSADPNQEFKFRLKLFSDKELNDVEWEIDEPREITVTKVWENDTEEDRPESIKVNLEVYDSELGLNHDKLLDIPVEFATDETDFDYYTTNNLAKVSEFINKVDASKEYVLRLFKDGNMIGVAGTHVSTLGDGVYEFTNKNNNTQKIRLILDSENCLAVYGNIRDKGYIDRIVIGEVGETTEPERTHTVSGNWVKNNNNTWTYTFYVPQKDQIYKVYEAGETVVTETGSYEVVNNYNNKVDVRGNTATITNIFTEDNKYQINYFANGGKFDNQTQENTVIYDSPTRLHIGDSLDSTTIYSGTYEEPIRVGYIFEGWYLDETCIKPYEDNYQGRNFNLFAKWERLPGEVTIDKSKWSSETVYDINLQPQKYRETYGFERKLSLTLSEVEAIENVERIDDETTDKHAYRWVENNTTYWWSDAGTIHLPQDASYMFSEVNYQTIDLSDFDSSDVTSMIGMFRNANDATSINISNFDTSNVTDMKHLFDGCSALTSINLSNFNTSEVTDMDYMFNNMSSVDALDVSKFDTSKVTSMERMFAGLSNVESLDLSNFDTANVTDMTQMFANDTSLRNIYVSDKWSIENVTDGNETFLNDLYLPNFKDYETSVNNAHYNEGGYLTFKESNTGANVNNNVISLTNLFNINSIFNINTVHAEDGIKITDLGNGEYEIILKNNETASFTNIPAGTSYQVYEETPDGWVLVEQRNVSGQIEPLDESLAEFFNKYQPGTTSVQFSGTKTLDNRPAEENAFTFELWEGETLIETVKTLSGGFVQFSVITYEEAGEHTYTVKEKNTKKSTIDYDEHVETINVSVTEDGEGGLTAQVTYDEDGMVFANNTKPGSLQIKKRTNLTTSENRNDEFTVKITFNNENGTPLSEDENIYWYKVDSNGNPITRSRGLFSFFTKKQEIDMQSSQLSPIEEVSNPEIVENVIIPSETQEDFDIDANESADIVSSEPGENDEIIEQVENNQEIEECLSCQLKKQEKENNRNNEEEAYEISEHDLELMERYGGFNEFRNTSDNVEKNIDESNNLGNTSFNTFNPLSLFSFAKISADEFDPDDGVIEIGETFVITYDATEDGQFDDGSRYNYVTYKRIPLLKRYSHTPNINDNGDQSGTYRDNTNTTDVVKIDGAKQLKVKIRGSTESCCDYVYVFRGSDTSSTSLSGRLSGSFNKEYIVEGDEVTFTFHSDGSVTNYGYYAVIEAVMENEYEGYDNINDAIVTNGKAFIVLEGEYKEPEYLLSDNIHFFSFNGDLSDDIGGDSTFFATYADDDVIDQGYYDGVFWKVIKVGQRTQLQFGDPLIDQEFTDRQRARTGQKAQYYYSLNTSYTNKELYPWHKHVGDVQDIIFIGNVKGSKSLPGLFEDFRKVETFDLEKFDVSEVEDFSYWFANIGSDDTADITLDLSHFDTSNGKNFSNMFAGRLDDYNSKNYNYTSTRPWINTYNSVGKIKNIIVSDNFSVENANDLSYMFAGSDINNLNDILSGFETYNATNMEGMFSLILNDSLDVSSFDTTNVTNMHGMFAFLNLDSLDLSNFDTSNVNDMSYMFIGLPQPPTYYSYDSRVATRNYQLKADSSIGSLDISSFDFSNVENISHMFSITKLESLDMPDFKSNKINNAGNLFAGADIANIDLDKFDFGNTFCFAGMFNNTINSSNANQSIDVSKFDTSNGIDFHNMFRYSEFINIIGLNNWDVSKAEDMGYMFYNSKANIIRVPNWSPNNLKIVSYMFYNSKANVIDIYNLDTRSIDMYKEREYWDSTDHAYHLNESSGRYMFQNASISLIRIGPNFSFYGISSPTYGVMLPGNEWDNLDTGEHRTSTQLRNEYNQSTTNLHGTWSRIIAQVVYDSSDQSLRFYDARRGLELTSTQTLYTVESNKEYATDNIPWRSIQSNVRKVVIEDDLHPTNISAWFSNLSNANDWNLDKLDTSNTTSMKYTFYGCSNLPEDIIQPLDTHSLIYANHMFGYSYNSNSNVRSLDLSNKDFSNLVDASYMFSNQRNLANLNLEGIVTNGSLNNMNYMFYYCRALTGISIGLLDTSNVTSMESTFQYSGIKEIDFTNNNLQNLQNASYLFADAPLEKADFTGVELSNLTDARFMFAMNTSSYYPNVKQVDNYEIIGLDTSNIKIMNGMFAGVNLREGTLDFTWLDTTNADSAFHMFSAVNADVLDLTGVTFENTENLRNMFSRTIYRWSDYISNRKIGELLIPDLDPTKAIARIYRDDPIEDPSSYHRYHLYNGVDAMFDGADIDAITVGPNFAFGPIERVENTGYVDRNTSNPLYITKKPWTNNTWIRDDYNDETGPYSPEEMQEYNNEPMGSLSGRYIRYPKWFNYDAKGGQMITDERVPAAEYIKLPIASEITRPGYNFLGWSLYDNATNPQYNPGYNYYYNADHEDSTTNEITMYAVWEYDGKNSVIVNHYQESVDGRKYNLVDTDITRDVYGTSVNVEPRNYEGFYLDSGESGIVTIPEDSNIVREFKYNRNRYTINFDGNGATSGTMKDVINGVGGVSSVLPNVAFSKKGSLFIGWNTQPDGSGKSYLNGQTVTNVGKNGETVTLYAQWQTNENELTPTQGVVYITMKAGETVVIPDLPYGTTYTIEEVDLPAGWALDNIQGSTGSIKPNVTNNATLNNKYEASGQTIIQAHKVLEGATISDGQFTFRLTDSNKVTLQTVRNSEVDNNKKIATDSGEIDNPYYGMALVQFDPIEYTTADIGRSFTYYIYEDATGDDKVNYDSRNIRVTVYVYDAGSGDIRTNVSYYNSDSNYNNIFTNTMKPGDLTVSKSIVNQTAVSKETEFEYELKLYDTEGNEIDGTYNAKIKHEGYTEPEEGSEAMRTRYSHTPNLDDNGISHGEYSNSMRTNEVVTIPNATQLEVVIKYNSESWYDYVVMWEGAHPGYSPDRYGSDFASSITGALSGYGEQKYTIMGDSVTFGFYSDGSVTYNYGYYATITPNEAFTTATQVTTGEVFKLKGNEEIEIYSLPHGARYEIVEKDAPGWELISSSKDTGTIEASTVQNASFRNVYSTAGGITIEMDKLLYGDDLINHNFVFELTDNNGNVLATASPDENGKIKFTSISYDYEDDGMVYTYYVREVIDENDTVIDEWDEHLLEVNVAVNDDGQGKLVTDVTLDAQDANFRNYVLRNLEVSKTVDGNYADTNKEFNFRLDLSGDYDKHEITYIKTLKNGTTEDGTVTDSGFTFTLKDNETIRFSGIVKGVEYDVVELSNTDNYVVTVDDGETKSDGTHVKGTLDDNKAVAFTNTRNEYQNIRVNKSATGPVDRSEEFEFTMNLSKLDPNTTYKSNKGNYTSDADGKLSVDFKLKVNDYIEFEDLPVYTLYTISENDYSMDGYVTRVAKGYAQLVESRTISGNIDRLEDINITFDNMIIQDLEVSKKLAGNYVDNRDEFRFELRIDDSGNWYHHPITWSKGEESGTLEDSTFLFRLKDNETIKFEGIVKGVKYDIVELDANSDDYVSSVDGGVVKDDGLYSSGTLNDDKSVVFTNTRNKYQDLIISKSITAVVPDNTKEFEFTINLTGLDPNTVYKTDKGDGFTSDADGKLTATVKLKADETVTMIDLPYGSSYEVSETDYTADGYLASYSVNGSEYQDGNKVSGSISTLNDVNISFDNKSITNLEISKKTDGNYADKSKQFEFKVSFGGNYSLNPITYIKDDEIGTVNNGRMDFTLADNETIRFEGIIRGASFDVVELNNDDNYVVTVNNGAESDDGTHVTGIMTENKEVAFTNTRNEYQNLRLAKMVTGETDPDTEFEFTIILSKLDKETVYTTAEGQEYTSDEEGNLEVVVKLKADEIIEFIDLPVNSEYTIKEKDYRLDGFETSVSKQIDAEPEEISEVSGVITYPDDVNIIFNNTVKKVINGRKFWIDDGVEHNNAEEIKLVLYRTVNDDKQEVSEDEYELFWEGDTYHFVNLDLADEDGNEYIYSVEEEAVDKYSSAYEYDAENDLFNIINTKENGKFTVSKKVSGNIADENKLFKFTITLTNSEGKPVSGIFSGVEFVDGVGQIELKHDESKTIETYLDVNYLIKEDPENYVPNINNVTGTVSEEEASYEFINNLDKEEENGGLIIRKVVKGEKADITKEFNFTITLSDNTINGYYGDVNFVDGVGQFKLKHNRAIEVDNLPAGITYEVSEESVENYEILYNGEVGTIEADDMVVCTVTNIHTPPEEPPTPPTPPTPPRKKPPYEHPKTGVE